VLGKARRATRIVDRFSIPNLSTGGMLRDAVAEGTAAGLRVKHIMDRGEQVPDDIVRVTATLLCTALKVAAMHPLASDQIEVVAEFLDRARRAYDKEFLTK
jgi:adenylate kinase family enzyme